MSEAVEKRRSGSLYWIHCIIMLVLMLSGWFLSPGAVITELGMKTIGIFAGLIYGWILLDLIWPSLLGLVVLSFTGFGTLADLFQQGFGSEIVLLIIFFSIFTKWLENIGLTNTIAQWLMARQILVGRPYWFISMIFLVTFIVAVFVGIYAAIFLMWGICYKLLNNLGYAKREKLSCFILIGVAFVSIMGMVVTPWSPWSMMGIKGLASSTGLSFELLPYSIFMITISFVSVLLFILFGKLIVKIDVSKLKNADYGQMSDGIDYTKEQKIGTVLVVLFMVALYSAGFFSEKSFLGLLLQPLGALGMILIVVIILCMSKMEGKPIFGFNELASTSIPWPMVCLLATIGPLGSALMSADAGIVKALMSTLKPIFSGQSPIMMYVLICLICCVATQFLNNTILLVVMTPLFCQLALMFDANPMIAAAMVLFGLTAALATPGASSRAGLVFGNAEWIDVKQAYLQGMLSVVAVFLALICIGIPLGMMLF